MFIPFYLSLWCSIILSVTGSPFTRSAELPQLWILLSLPIHVIIAWFFLILQLDHCLILATGKTIRLFIATRHCLTAALLHYCITVRWFKSRLQGLQKANNWESNIHMSKLWRRLQYMNINLAQLTPFQYFRVFRKRKLNYGLVKLQA